VVSQHTAAGTIDANGLYTANGQAGGNITVVAKHNNDSAQTTLTIQLKIVENLAGLDANGQATLTAGGGAQDPSWTIVYPYNGTIFPRGIPAPQIHSNGASGEAFYLHIAMTGCEYQGFLPAAPQVLMSQATWDALGTCTTARRPRWSSPS